MHKEDNFKQLTEIRKYEDEKNEFYTRLWDTTNKELRLYILYHFPQYTQFIEDIIMDVFTISLNHYEELKSHENIRGWLYTTLKYKIKELYRASIKAEFVDFDKVINLLQQLPTPTYEDLKEICEIVLSKEVYDIIVDYYYIGYNLDEIADKNKSTKSAIKMKLQRAYKKLKKEITKILLIIALLLINFLHI